MTKNEKLLILKILKKEYLISILLFFIKRPITNLGICSVLFKLQPKHKEIPLIIDYESLLPELNIEKPLDIHNKPYWWEPVFCYYDNFRKRFKSLWIRYKAICKAIKVTKREIDIVPRVQETKKVIKKSIYDSHEVLFTNNLTHKYIDGDYEEVKDERYD